MEDKKNGKEQKHRIVVLITEPEKKCLLYLARNDQRSMSGYLRSLLAREISLQVYPD